MKPLEHYLTQTQKEIFHMLRTKYRTCADTFVLKGKYLLVKGEAPVMLLAHLDTVHKERVKTICHSDNGNILMSPQGIGGDDRCGVYALNAVYEQAKVKPWLLFTCDEEVGGVGASAFCEKHKKGRLPKELSSLKLLIEIDRKGRNDAVYYDCENPEFESYITGKGFATGWGSFSDISYVAPALGVAAVNLSSGYYNAHTLHEYINRKHLNQTVKKVLEIVDESTAPNFPRFEYIEAVRSFGRGWGHWGNDYYYDRGSSALRPKNLSPTKGDKVIELEPDYDGADLSHIPDSIREEYFALLDFYTPEELDAMREEMGDGAITMLCQSEFGEDYYGMFGYDEEEEVLPQLRRLSIMRLLPIGISKSIGPAWKAFGRTTSTPGRSGRKWNGKRRIDGYEQKTSGPRA